MKKLNIVVFGAMLALGLNMQACGGTGTQKAAEAQVQTTPTEEPQTVAITEDVVEEFTESSTLPETITEPIVIDFNADWCGPCQMFKPVFHKLAGKYADKARFISVNVDNNRALAIKYGVSSIPQITIVKPDGQIVNTVGAMDEQQFKSFLDSNL